MCIVMQCKSVQECVCVHREKENNEFKLVYDSTTKDYNLIPEMKSLQVHFEAIKWKWILTVPSKTNNQKKTYSV